MVSAKTLFLPLGGLQLVLVEPNVLLTRNIHTIINVQFALVCKLQPAHSLANNALKTIKHAKQWIYITCWQWH